MPLFKYEAVVAKSRCLYGKLLKTQDYDNLLKCSDVSDIAVYLHENTAYNEFLDESNLRKINRSKLEYYIKRSMLGDYLKMYKFTFGNERYFISLLMAKYEFEYILSVWREFVMKNADPNSVADLGTRDDEDHIISERLLELQAIYKDNPRIDLESLQRITTADQFINAIRNSSYFHVFEKYIHEDIFNNFTVIETAIYDEYYKMLHDGAKLFEKETREKIQDFISVEADFINLCRMSRMMFNFNAKPEEIAPLLLPIRNRLTDNDINILLNSEDRESFLLYCQSYLKYGKKQSFHEYESMTSYMNSFMYKYYKSKINVGSSGFDVVIRYFHVKEYEVMNLFYLIEGIRYKMQPDYIRKYMYGLDYAAERGIV